MALPFLSVLPDPAPMTEQQTKRSRSNHANHESRMFWCKKEFEIGTKKHDLF